MEPLAKGKKISRRTFMKGSAASIAALGALASSGGVGSMLQAIEKAQATAANAEKVVPTICGGCHNNCGMLVHVRDGMIAYIEGNPDHPFNRGALCAKGESFRELVYSPYRLKKPLRRVGKRGEGKWEELTWDRALDYMAEQLTQIRDKYGPETLFYTSGAPVMNEVRNAFKEFYAQYGTPNGYMGNLCYTPRAVVLLPTYGFRDEEDYNQTNLIINWGGNPFSSMRPGSYAAYNRKGFTTPILDAKQRGAKFIVIDPVFTETAAKADQWISLRPGTDGALALAMLNVIIGKGLYDSDFVLKWTVGFDELRAHVAQYSPDWAQGVTGVPADQIVALAQTYATTKPATIHEANTFANHTNATQAVRAIACLKAITGNLEVPGGNVCFPGVFGDITPIEKGNPAGIKTSVQVKTPHVLAKKFPLLPAGPLALEGVFTEEASKPRALMIYHTNPILSNAGSIRVKEAFDKLEFIAVMDIFLSKTAEYADLVLPDTSFLETYDYRTYPSELGPIVALRQPTVSPMYESRSFYEVEYDLAKRMGLADKYPWSNVQEFLSYALSPSKLDLPKLEANPVQIVGKNEYYKHEKGLLRPDGQPGFNTPSGKVELYSSVLEKLGYEPLPIYHEPAESPVSAPDLAKKFPLIGVNRRSPFYVHFKYRMIPYLRDIEPEPQVYLNPSDAQSRGISGGEWVTIRSARGQIRQKAVVSERVQPGVAWISGGWGNSWDFEDAAYNELTDYTEVDPMGQCPSISSFQCEVTKA